MRRRGFKVTSSGKFLERVDGAEDGTEFGSPDAEAIAQIADAYGISADGVEAVVKEDGSDPTAGEEVIMYTMGWDEADMRERRNRRLLESDWSQYEDSPLSDSKKAEWATYRQALRDLPATSPNANAVTWPTEPAS
jgi:hypothetical protein